MGIEDRASATLTRRQAMAVAVGTLQHPFARAASGALLLAAWDTAQGSRVGLLRARGSELAVDREIKVPTRAHGLLAQRPAHAASSVLAVARRPGDWLLRWWPASGRTQWCWPDDGNVFTGHALASADGALLFTTETEPLGGEGRIGVREAGSLRKLDEWPTHGRDPHELVRGPEGDLWVANGGIPTLPETGRSRRDLGRMDSSLVRLDARGGALRGQWRLPDARLGMRHLAWGLDVNGDPVLGIALQAEHDDAALKAAAPVLALFDGSRLRTASLPQPLGGYGGAIAFDGAGFAVSCTRGHGVARFDPQGRWRGFWPLPSACALDAAEGQLWAGGAQSALHRAGGAGDPVRRACALRLDNHWRQLA